jgi:hypothetical protein
MLKFEIRLIYKFLLYSVRAYSLQLRYFYFVSKQNENLPVYTAQKTD